MTSHALHFRPSVLAIVIGAALSSASLALPAPQAPPVCQELKSFEAFPFGTNPYSTLIQGTDGALYGTSELGGDFDSRGAVLRLIFTASWSNYGAGLSGTKGVPDFTSSANPVLGTKITLSADNSRGRHAARGVVDAGAEPVPGKVTPPRPILRANRRMDRLGR